VAFVSSVTVTFVDVVDVIVVALSLVAAPLAVGVRVVLVDSVDIGVALVPVIVMDVVDMAVVEVVRVPVVIGGRMTAFGPVVVLVIRVRLVRGRHGRCSFSLSVLGLLFGGMVSSSSVTSWLHCGWPMRAMAVGVTQVADPAPRRARLRL